MNVTVLLSGGIDSAVCLAFYRELGHRASAIHVDYGQSARNQERRATEAIAEHYQIPLKMIAVTGSKNQDSQEIIGRNAFLISLALLECGTSSQIIALGIHAGTDYADCSPRFVTQMEMLVGFQTDGQVQVGAPFVAWTKKQVWDFGKLKRVPISLCYSCERSDVEPCGQCLSCRDVRRLNAC